MLTPSTDIVASRGDWGKCSVCRRPTSWRYRRAAVSVRACCLTHAEKALAERERLPRIDGEIPASGSGPPGRLEARGGRF